MCNTYSSELFTLTIKSTLLQEKQLYKEQNTFYPAKKAYGLENYTE